MVDKLHGAEISKSHIMAVKTDHNILTAAKGGGIDFVGQIFLFGSQFVTGFLLARFLGAGQLGLYNLALSTAVLASGVALLGLPSAMVRYVAMYVSRRDQAGLWGTIQLGVGFGSVVSIILGIGVFIFANLIAIRWFQEPALVPLLRIVSFIIPVLALSHIVASTIRGFKNMQYPVTSKSIIEPIAKFIFILAFVVIGLNATTALIAYSASVIISFVALLYFLNILFPLKRPLFTARRDKREIFLYATPVYLSNLISIFGGNIQIMLLGVLGTAAQVGVFAVAMQVNTIGRMFHSSVVTATAPIVSELYDKGKIEDLGRLYQTVTKWTFALNLPLFLLLLLMPTLILNFFGQSFVSGAIALSILAWANLVQTGTGICGLIINMTGNTRLRLFNSIVSVVVTVGLNIWLIPIWGLAGAAIASLSAAVILNLFRIVQVFVLFRLQPYNSSFIKPTLAGLTAFLLTWGIMHLLLPLKIDILIIILNTMVLSLTYVGVLLLLGLSPQDKMVLNRVRARIKI